MALKDIWVDLEDKVAGVPDSGSELTVKPINDIAHSVIENENEIKELKNKEIKITIDTEMDDTSENPVQNKVVKSYVDGEIENVNNELENINSSIGETETALDMITSQQESIIAIQEELIGGDIE